MKNTLQALDRKDDRIRELELELVAERNNSATAMKTLAAETLRRQEAERERDKIQFLIEAVWDAAKGNTVSDFALSHGPVQFIALQIDALKAAERLNMELLDVLKVVEAGQQHDLPPEVSSAIQQRVSDALAKGAGR